MDPTAKLAAWRAAAAPLDTDALATLILDLDERRSLAAEAAGLPLASPADLPLLIMYLHDQLSSRAGADVVERATRLSLGVRLSSDLATSAARFTQTADRFTELGRAVEAGLLALAEQLGPRSLRLHITQAELPELAPAAALTVEHAPPRLLVDLALPNGQHHLRLKVEPRRKRATRTVKGLFGSREESVEVVVPQASAERWVGENCLEDGLSLPDLTRAVGEALQAGSAHEALELLGVQLRLPALVVQALAVRDGLLRSALATVAGSP